MGPVGLSISDRTALLRTEAFRKLRRPRGVRGKGTGKNPGFGSAALGALEPNLDANRSMFPTLPDGVDGGRNLRTGRRRRNFSDVEPLPSVPQQEWRSIGVQQSRGWTHYAIHKPEPHILLFRSVAADLPQVFLPHPHPARHADVGRITRWSCFDARPVDRTPPPRVSAAVQRQQCWHK